MAVNPLVPGTAKFSTKEKCKRICIAEPHCRYYFYVQDEQSCEMYPEPHKKCNAIMGTLEIDKCLNSESYAIFYICNMQKRFCIGEKIFN